MALPTPLPSSRLHAHYAPAKIPADSSAGIRPATYGGRAPFQDRAMKALDLALAIRSSGYNVYLSGEPGVGRTHMLLSYLGPVARRMETPPDLVYLNNFSDIDRPVLFRLPAGQGDRLRRGLADCVEAIRKGLDTRLGGVSFSRKHARLLESFQTARSILLHKMNDEAGAKGFSVDLDENGEITLYPLDGGRRVSEEEFSKLDSGIRIALRQRSDTLAMHMSGYVHELAKAEEGFLDQERDLASDALREAVESALAPLERRMEKVACEPPLKDWFAAMREDMLRNADAFIGPSRSGQGADARQPQGAGPDREWIRLRYGANLFVDNSATKGAPIVVEDNPVPANLLGCLERESELGALVTDFSLIQAGSLHRACGGFLVLRVSDLVQHEVAWEGLLRALKSGKARLEDGSEAPESGSRAKGPRPQPVPIDAKVILIGDEYTYEELLDAEERFPRLFRIKAEMTDVMPRSAAAVRHYLAVISRIVETEKLPPFDRTALAWLVDFGSRLCEDKRRLSLRFPALRDHMIEAAATAAMKGSDTVTAQILEDTYAERNYRANLVEEQYMEEYDRGLIKVETAGSAIGQVNGLSVTTYGTFEFGLPHRISCTVGVGKDGIIDLEREAALGGPIHTKAMMILGSYLTGMFASRKPLALSGSLFFEQSYAGIEGDSASGAELAALLSALAEVPVRRDLAFTGAVSHSGQIMAVGGVATKIEGFFKVCSRKRLTGTQGVIIPADNVDQLILSPEIRCAVDQGLFSIWPVETIEDALQLLTGMPAGRRRKDGTFTKGSLYELVDRRLQRLGEYGERAFRRKRGRGARSADAGTDAGDDAPGA